MAVFIDADYARARGRGQSGDRSLTDGDLPVRAAEPIKRLTAETRSTAAELTQKRTFNSLRFSARSLRLRGECFIPCSMRGIHTATARGCSENLPSQSRVAVKVLGILRFHVSCHPPLRGIRFAPGTACDASLPTPIFGKNYSSGDI